MPALKPKTPPGSPGDEPSTYKYDHEQIPPRNAEKVAKPRARGRKPATPPPTATAQTLELAAFRRPREQSALSPGRGLPSFRRTRSCPELPTRGIAFHERRVWTKLELRVRKTLKAMQAAKDTGTTTASAPSARPRPGWRCDLTTERLDMVVRAIEDNMAQWGVCTPEQWATIRDDCIHLEELRGRIGDAMFSCCAPVRTVAARRPEDDPLLADVLACQFDLLATVRSHVLGLQDPRGDTELSIALVARFCWIRRKLCRRFYVLLHRLPGAVLADEEAMRLRREEQRTHVKLMDLT